WYPGKEGIALVDLPIEFNFVKSMHKGTYTKEYFEENLRLMFKDMAEHELKIIFVTHKTTIKVISEAIYTELDLVINSMDERAHALIDSIGKRLSTNSPVTLTIYAEISKKIKAKGFYDFDLLEPWFTDIASPSPAFLVEPSPLNNDWNQLRYHYFTWGYKENANGKAYYAPSCWVRIGYTPALTPAQAHLVACLEMVLGKGHSISLTLAHTACNEGKDNYVKILTERMNRDLPTKHRLGFNVKTINKWKLMKHA
nr:hypothetical protein [Candidatus Sigynarchaeota archaeon]